MTDLAPSRVDKFLAGVSTRPPPRGNLVFALDATASRERTWDTACQLQVPSFYRNSHCNSSRVWRIGGRSLTKPNPTVSQEVM